MRIQEISEDEVKLYDRQIRVWGMEAQKRLKNLKVLLIGCGGIAAEVGKNLVLAGVRALVLLDSRKCDVTMLNSSFLLHHNDLGENVAECSKKRLAALNPNVEMSLLTFTEYELLSKGKEWFQEEGFDCIVCTRPFALPLEIYLDEMCRSIGASFISAGAAGSISWIFVDLNGGELEFHTKGNDEIQVVNHVQSFCSLAESIDCITKRSIIDTIRSKSLKRMAIHINPIVDYKMGTLMHSDYEWGKEVPAVSSVTGGLVAQEILKTVTRDSAALRNWVVIDCKQFQAVSLDLMDPLKEEREDVDTVEL